MTQIFVLRIGWGEDHAGYSWQSIFIRECHQYRRLFWGEMDVLHHFIRVDPAPYCDHLQLNNPRDGPVLGGRIVVSLLS